MTLTAGLDVGGAHLKVALAEDGRLVEVRQFVCPLWQGLDKLDAALAAARPLTDRVSRIAATMTGELSDLFPDRRTGVETLVAALTHAFGPDTRFWLGLRGFGDAATARTRPTDVGSTNFLATAALVARYRPNALLIDFGSTTVDIIPVQQGTPTPRGLTDADRQTTGELVYTGLTRTAVMGVATRAPWRGAWVTLAREYLATMADVRRVLGENLDDLDLHATADGNGKSHSESIVRLARMLGRDADQGTDADWQSVASWLREAQLRSITDGAHQVLSASGLAAGDPVVVAGIGAPEARVVAARLGRPAIAFGELIPASKACRLAATQAAPASAVALLLP